MCGGITFKFDEISEEELAQFFLPEELAAFRAMGHAESFYWARRPVLPASPSPRPSPSRGEGEGGGGIHLYDWGNREKNVDLPKTGWARIESLEQGRWNHLHPAEIEIPTERGYEKKVWFDITGTISGILIEKNGVVRAYMITVPASKEYAAKTGHDRMPKITKGKIIFTTNRRMTSATVQQRCS